MVALPKAAYAIYQPEDIGLPENHLSTSDTTTAYICKWKAFPNTDILLTYETVLSTVQVFIPLLVVCISHAFIFSKVKYHTHTPDKTVKIRKTSLLHVTTTFRLIVGTYFVLTFVPAVVNMLNSYMGIYQTMMWVKYHRQIEGWLYYGDIMRMCNSAVLFPFLYGDLHKTMYRWTTKKCCRKPTSPGRSVVFRASKTVPFTRAAETFAAHIVIR